MSTWSVAADDRTGALEVGGLLAAHFGPVVVSVGARANGSGVVDLATRAMSTDRAAEVMGRYDEARIERRFHKIDSTLRGNWAAELRARVKRDGRLVVLAAWPELGRTCVGGVVHVHGAPIGSLREHMPELEVLSDVVALRRWVADGGGAARAVACDLTSTDQMLAAADALAGCDALIAGPAGPIAAAVVAGERSPTVGSAEPFVAPSPNAALVVCGSANPIATQQVERVRALVPQVRVVSAPDAHGPLSIDIAHQLADRARALLADRPAEWLVVVGGDTTAALLGDGPRRVCGLAAPGMPWSLAADDGGPVVVTKAGGFGDADALVRLLRREGIETGENG